MPNSSDNILVDETTKLYDCVQGGYIDKNKVKRGTLRFCREGKRENFLTFYPHPDLSYQFEEEGMYRIIIERL